MNEVKKLKELILYIAELEKDDPKFGAIKLNKILYYSDVSAYLRLGHPITEATYQHLDEGPAPLELLSARGQLIDDGAAELESRLYFSRPQERVVPLRGPDLSHYKEEEMQIVRDVVEYLRPLNATEVSELSHREWGWKLTDYGEEIPYQTAWLSAEPLTQEQTQAGQALWREISGMA